MTCGFRYFCCCFYFAYICCCRKKKGSGSGNGSGNENGSGDGDDEGIDMEKMEEFYPSSPTHEGGESKVGSRVMPFRDDDKIVER